MEDNPSAEHRAPLHALHGMGQSRVQRYNRTIEAEARRQGVDPDLVRAIVYVENAQGWYGHPFEQVDIGKSYLPMNIRPDYWAPLGFKGKNYHHAPTNIRVGISLIKRISERLANPTVAKIATLYQSLSQDRVSDYGARVADVYRKKPWQGFFAGVWVRRLTVIVAVLIVVSSLFAVFVFWAESERGNHDLLCQDIVNPSPAQRLWMLDCAPNYEAVLAFIGVSFMTVFVIVGGLILIAFGLIFLAQVPKKRV